MNKFVEAKEGCKFVPTEKADERVKAKYDETRSPVNILKQYRYHVLLRWIEQGYVEQVEETV